MKIKYLTLFLFLIYSTQASANKLMVELFSNFTSSSDDHSGTFEFSRMTNGVFLGAAISKKQQLYFGQNVIQYSRSFNTGSTTEVSTLELGPRFTFFFSENKTWHMNLIWNPYAKGERTSGGSTYTIDGWSYEISFGYQYKVTKALYMGATMVYHSLAVTTVTNSANVESETSYTYSSIYPLITLNMRF
ncbi:MAG: hypothetical protein EP326_09805 [Deltaproteobacteria bacterium]|nr:MAG: hypothetical protein EP326_09805 [Deltaproteobacteria bacterium]TNF31908.1 MAG: hypothetical protein EP319_00810 [Deltaproteobacteria bacterium]